MKNLKMKKEFKVIADLLPNNTRVLDVGCGDGSLMSFLEKGKEHLSSRFRIKQRECSKMYP